MAAFFTKFTAVLTFWLATLAFPIHASTSHASGKPDTHAPSRVVAAKINGQPIYLDQLEDQVQAALKKQRPKLGAGSIPDTLLTQVQAAALDRHIAAELLRQESQKEKSPAIEQKIAEALAKHSDQTGADRTDAGMLALRNQIYFNEYLASNDLIHPRVPEVEVKAYYERHKQSFASKKDTAHVRHILIQAGKDATPEEKKQAKKGIERVRQLLLDGTSFSEVAKEYSQDANASAGGDLGYIERGYMPAAFESVAFSLEPGAISDLVQTDFGFHVLEVLDRKPAGTIAGYEEVREFLERGLNEQLRTKKMAEHIQNLKDKARIDILLVNVAPET